MPEAKKCLKANIILNYSSTFIEEIPYDYIKKVPKTYLYDDNIYLYINRRYNLYQLLHKNEWEYIDKRTTTNMYLEIIITIISIIAGFVLLFFSVQHKSYLPAAFSGILMIGIILAFVCRTLTRYKEEYITYKIHSVPSPILAYLKGRAL